MKRITIAILLLLFSYFFVSPQLFGVTSAVECEDNKPKGRPILTSAVPGEESVTLTWIEGQGPITHYLVAYGRTNTEVEYGNPYIGSQGTTTYTVESLTKGVKYYFKIRPVNGCRTGSFSNKLPATPGQKTATDLVTSKSVINKPNLSLYKPVLGESVSKTSTAEGEAKTLIVAATNSGQSPKCTTCMGWQFLIVEIMLLILYFSLAKRFKFLKQIYSILIPIIMYVAFWKINQGCSLNDFSCKYYIPLNVISFMLVLIVYKNKYMKLIKTGSNKK
ncbi:MAG: hypothetical protein US68_C0024G0006 [Candidatus Shapirobacteria bacterium GW2011_GWE1_38_10]|uniref:Fibronectin type-III domain-containing protein n=1 Tax=Candidatus Shapirobacteria bacterium GW2011_GWE1_38_10 TaxID=1618488 RepID=A0A0G0L7Z7_9BACT|nr:MAG: hypothetical protein US68_C0024G0006 [Candidatus Shapirobacteria bacterium GW2011_GWE1_38_10]